MTGFLPGILKITLFADLLIGLVWLLSIFLGSGSGYRWRKLVWLILALRLLIPVSVSFADISERLPLLRVSLPAAEEKQGDLQSPEEEIEAGPAAGTGTVPKALSPAAGNENAADSAAENARQAESIQSSEGVRRTEDIRQMEELPQKEDTMTHGRLPSGLFLACIWLAGLLITARFHISQYLHTRKCILEAARPCRDKRTDLLAQRLFQDYGIKKAIPILVSDDVFTPMVTGYRSPVLLIDRNSCNAPELEAMLRHELCHYKYGDLWYKLLMVAVCDIYWFNPVLRIMKRMAFFDVECVCDSRAAGNMDPEEKKRYGSMLIKLAQGNGTSYTAGFSSGKKTMKERLNNLFTDKKKKTGYFAAFVLLAAVLFLSMTVVFAGEDSGNQREDGTALAESDSGNEQKTETAQPVKVFRVDSVEELYLDEPFQLERYHMTNRVTVDNHFFIDDDKVLWGYGRNSYGQLGIGRVDDLEVLYQEPIKIAENVVSVDESTNGYFTIYLTEDGKLYGMGMNMMGVLGKEPGTESLFDDFGENSQVLEPMLLMEQVAFARAGMYSVVALKEDGSVWWWGEYKALSATSYSDGYWYKEEWPENPRKMMYTRPHLMLEDCVYATTGNWTGAAITKDGELYTWGLNIWGQCGTEVTGDDYVRTPEKVLDNVKMVWPERMMFQDSRTEMPEFMTYNTSYNDNLFVQLKDGTLLACGLELGDKARTIQLEGDMLQPATREYSDSFVPIDIFELSDEDIWALLEQCETGSTAEEAEKILEDNQIAFLECFEEGGTYPLYLEIEEGRFYLYLDEEGKVKYFSDEREE